MTPPRVPGVTLPSFTEALSLHVVLDVPEAAELGSFRVGFRQQLERLVGRESKDGRSLRLLVDAELIPRDFELIAIISVVDF